MQSAPSPPPPHPISLPSNSTARSTLAAHSHPAAHPPNRRCGSHQNPLSPCLKIRDVCPTVFLPSPQTNSPVSPTCVHLAASNQNSPHRVLSRLSPRPGLYQIGAATAPPPQSLPSVHKSG